MLKANTRIFTRCTQKGITYDFCPVCMDLTPHDKDILYQLAEAEQSSMSHIMRTLIRAEGKRLGVVSEYVDTSIPEQYTGALGNPNIYNLSRARRKRKGPVSVLEEWAIIKGGNP